MKNWYKILLVIAFFSFAFNACQKEEFTTSASDNISLSTDTVTFDTIFTQIGSITKIFKIYNKHDKYITLSNVYLKGGANSNFRMNFDGLRGDSYKNIEIPPQDSLYIFVEVTLDPVGGNLPLVIYDAIVFICNGNEQEVSLEAFGQDVHLINGEILETQTWKNDKPYLIYNSTAIDSNNTLTIKKGVKIYFHHNSSMLVWGKLIVDGSYEEPVVFEGDRFDLGYGETAGRWGTIFIHPNSQGNSINYAIIKNAAAGIQIGEPGDNLNIPTLELRNTYIVNTSFASLIAYGAEITAYNCIFSDSQYHGLVLIMGGEYNFYHSTISMVGALEVNPVESNYLRSSPSYALILSNWQPYYTLNDNFMIEKVDRNNALIAANFYNSIIYGGNELEFVTDDNEETEFNYYFDHCILKQAEDSIDLGNTSHFNKVILNEYPRFINDSSISAELDYRLDTLSPAKDIGSLDIVNALPVQFQVDYEGNSRKVDGKPDIGAFERIE